MGPQADCSWARQPRHNAIWKVRIIWSVQDRIFDKLLHQALAAERTNHLIPDAVLIRAAGTLLKLQQTGFQYAT